jgi:4-amino-4-deoxychorismate lyase
LAGIKHLNRLENVLARAEWRDPQIAEGLLCDSEGHVIGGTMSNLFLLRGGVLTTPALTGSGIAGVTRDVIIERAQSEGTPVRIAPVSVPDVRAADALFLVNSLIGVWPVAALDELAWAASPFGLTLENWIRDAARQ